MVYERIYEVVKDDYICLITDFNVGDVLISENGSPSLLMKMEDELAVLLVCIDEKTKKMAEVQVIGFPHVCHIVRKATPEESKTYREFIRAHTFYFDEQQKRIKRKCTETDYKDMSVDEANNLDTIREKREWVNIHNATANLYFIDTNGKIKMVEPSGWWY